MQEITCGTLAAEPSYLQDLRKHEPAKVSNREATVSRAVCVLDKPLQVQ